MILRANCKINLGLDILRRRADGYHDLETVMFPVRGLYDEVEVVRTAWAAVRPTARRFCWLSTGFSTCTCPKRS